MQLFPEHQSFLQISQKKVLENHTAKNLLEGQAMKLKMANKSDQYVSTSINKDKEMDPDEIVQ